MMVTAVESEGYWFPLPKGWIERPLGELFETQLGKMKGKNASSGEQFYYLKGRNIRWGKVQHESLETMHFSQTERVQYELLPGDLLVSEYGEVGRCTIWSGERSNCYFQNHIYRIRTNGVLSVEYLRYFLEYATKLPGFSRFVTQTSVQQISQSNLRSIPIPFNPSGVDGFVESMNLFDQALETKSVLIEKLRNLKAGIFSYLMGNEIEGSFIKGFWKKLPKDWNEKPLGELFDTQLGKMKSANSNEGEQFSYLKNKNVQWGDINIDDIETMHFTLAERTKYALTPGDLLVTEGGEVGRCAIWLGELNDCYIQNSIHRIRATGFVSVEYLQYFLEYATKMPGFQRFVQQTSIAHLSQGNLRSIPIPYPENIEEINNLIASMSCIDLAISSQSNELFKKTNIRKGLLFSNWGM